MTSSSLYFFDAVETPLAEDEYPPVFTTAIQHPKRRVTLEDPVTMLHHSPTSPINNQMDDEDDPLLGRGGPIESHSSGSQRFEMISRRPTIEHAKALSEPRVPQQERGFPGGLTVAELEECVSTFEMTLSLLLLRPTPVVMLLNHQVFLLSRTMTLTYRSSTS